MSNQRLELALAAIPEKDKAAAFDALVLEFQGKGRFVHSHRRVAAVRDSRYETVRDSRYEAGPSYRDVPVFEFKMLVEEHNDFLGALLRMSRKPIK